MNWNDLAPPVAKIKNPFKVLKPEQTNALRRILALEAAASGDAAGKYQREANTLRARLASRGLDVDALFDKRQEIIKQRRLAAEGINQAIVGQDVRLLGFILPLKFQDGKAVEFLLVPTIGACIHTPPPPANQIVHVRSPQGIVVERLYAPAWISGKLGAKRSMQKVSFIDGRARVAVSYTMQPALVIPAIMGNSH